MKTEHKYERIARQLQTQIAEGIFRPGDRLPSIRQLSTRERVSVSSVMQALTLLEARGLVLARAKSGFFVRHRQVGPIPRPFLPPARIEPQVVGICGIAAAVLQHSGDPSMLQLGAGLPAPTLLPADRLSRCLAHAARKQPERLVHYDIASGHPRLLRQIALRLAAVGSVVPVEEIHVATGAMEAMNLALRAVTNTGDTVAVELPCYFGILQILESLGLKALAIPGTSEHGIDLNLLSKAIRRHRVKAVLLIPSFNNPSGSCLSEKMRKNLLGLLALHELPLIENDIYGDLYFGEERPRPVKAFDEKGLVIHCSSFSKSLAPGLRVGWLTAGRFSAKVRQLKFTSTLTTPAINQIAIAEFLEHAPMERHLRHLRTALQVQVDQMIEAIVDCFPDGTAVSRPQGGLSLWVQLPEGVDAMDLHNRAAVERISIIPGQLFCPQAKISDHIRINCGHPVDKEILDGLRKLGELAGRVSG